MSIITVSSTGAITCLIAISLAAADCPTHLDERTVLALYDAGSRHQLDVVYRSQSQHDPAAKVIYAVKVRTFDRTLADDWLLQAIPRSEIEFRSADCISSPHFAELRSGLENVFQEYIEAVAEVVSKPGVSDEFMRRYLMMTVFSDGALAELLADLNVEVARSNARTFRRAAASLGSRNRIQICGSRSPCTMPPSP